MPQTIQIFLPASEPRGIRVAELTTRIVQVIDVPRSLLREFMAMEEAARVALYFLVGDAEDGTEPRVYVGQTEDLRTRLADHNRQKEFWQRALVLVSRTNSLTQTHVKFLEWHSLKETKRAGRYADENGNGASKPHTPAPLEADCLDIFETGKILLATLGYPVFDAVAGPDPAANASELFFLKASGASGRGIYTEEGFVVLADSIGRLENVRSIMGTGDERLRNGLLEAGVMRQDGDKVVFVKNHLFRTPSMAAVALTGRTANGWLEWKDQEGRTLDALKRQTTT